MKKKFSSVALTASMAVILSGCGNNYSDASHTDVKSQRELAEYCGIDLDKVKESIKEKNAKSDKKIDSFLISGEDCQINFSYIDNGDVKTASMSNDNFSSMLAYGGMGMLFGYLWANGSQRSSMANEYGKKRRNGSIFMAPYAGQYFRSNSRSLAGFQSGQRTSGINVSNGGKISTRTNSFRGLSSSGRSSAYSGG